MTNIFQPIRIFIYSHIVISAISRSDEMQPIFESAAELFGLLASPMRLRLLRVLCNGEQSVGAIVLETGAAQSNVSQHLAVLYRHRVVARRREGSQIYYRIANEMVVQLCRTVCTQFAIGEVGTSAYPALATHSRVESRRSIQSSGADR